MSIQCLPVWSSCMLWIMKWHIENGITSWEKSLTYSCRLIIQTARCDTEAVPQVDQEFHSRNTFWAVDIISIQKRPRGWSPALQTPSLPVPIQIRSNYFPKQSLNPACPAFIYLLAESFFNTEPCVVGAHSYWNSILPSGTASSPSDSTCAIGHFIASFFPLTSPQSPKWLRWCVGRYSNKTTVCQ